MSPIHAPGLVSTLALCWPVPHQPAPHQPAAGPNAAGATPAAAPFEPIPARGAKSEEETATGGQAYDLETVVITPGRKNERLFETPYSTQVVDDQAIERRAYRTTPQALRNIPGVLVQETAFGHGSPYIRGFTSFRTLMLIDGIRLNNSVFRPGPNQYWNTVDPLSVARFEVVKGPASVLYGSDAIGGTVNAITKSPYAWGAKSGFAGEALWRVNSAEHSHVARAELSGTIGDDIGYLIGANRKDFGDVEAGDPTGEQPNTGYAEWDGDLKVESFLGDGVRLVVAHQRVDQNDVPRTHRTDQAISFEGTGIGSDQLRDFDQDRKLSYVQMHFDEPIGGFDSGVVSLSYHEQDEIRRRIRSDGRREKQGFEVDTLGLFANATTETASGEWTIGGEVYRDKVDSFIEKYENQDAADDIQGPVADDATYDVIGVFVQNEYDVNERFTITSGVRYSFAAAEANEVLDPETETQVEIDENWDAVAGSLRMRYELEPDRWSLFGGASQGFRAPNLSDLSRLDSARSNEFEVPSTDLDPEYYTSYEIGLKYQGEDVSAEISTYYTDIRDQILRFPSGETNDEGDVIISKENVGDGEVYGVELGGAWRLQRDWTLFGNATWMEGEVENFPESDPEPVKDTITRQMPLTMQLGLRWDDPRERFWAEGLVVRAEDADQLSDSDERDTTRIPPGGTPGWATLDLMGGWRATDGIELMGGVQNITDEDYRVHGSGTNRPGRAFIFGVRASF